MENRQLAILKELSCNTTYITQQELCDKFHIQPRTLRDDIKNIRNQLATHGASIIQKYNQGYILQVDQETSFFNFLKQQFSTNEHQYPQTQQERIIFYIRYLLIHPSYISNQQLADEIFISKSTLQQDLKLVKKALQPYHLTLQTKLGYGVKISGNEADIRHCLFDYYFTYTTPKKHQVFSKQRKQHLEQLITTIFEQHHFQLVDVGFSNLIIHLLITLYRIEHGTYLKQSISLDQQANHEEITIANHICDQLEQHYHLEIPMEERQYIALHLIGKRSYSIEDEQYIRPEILNAINHIFTLIKKQFHLDLTGNIDLFTALALHIQPMLDRANYHISIPIAPIENIVTKYPLAYELSLETIHHLSTIFHIEIDPQEVSFLTLHYALALQKQEKTQKRVLIVCSSGMGTAKLLHHQISTILAQYPVIIETKALFGLSTSILDQYDLVFTTIPISIPTKTNIIPIHYDLSQIDHQAITQAYTTTIQNHAVLGCLDEHLFFNHKTFKDKWECIDFMINALQQQIPVPENCHNLVYEREKLSSTNIGNHIAIPHPSQLIFEETKLVICLLDQPLLWDHSDVSIVILLCLKNDSGQSTQLFQGVFSIFLNPQNIHTLLQHPTYDQLIRSFQDAQKEYEQSDIEDIFQ